MGLFDFFRRPPTRDEFAAKLIKEMRRAGVTEALTYDKDNDRILRGSGEKQNVINLTNFFREHLSLPPSKRKQHLVDRARLNQNLAKGDEVATDFEEARSHLRPKLWVRSALENTRLQIQVDGGDASKFDLPEYEIGSHLIASLVYDLPEAMVSVSKKQLSDWGVAYYEALEIARENLEQTQFAYAEIGEGCYAFASGDSYDACRLLLPSRMDQLRVTGDLIAMVPNRDSLLVTGSDDAQGLKIMVALAAKALEEPRPMVPIPLRLDGDAWVDWLPDLSHPLSASFRDLSRRFLLGEYSEQTQLLDRLHDKQGVDVFVASYTVVKKPDDSLYSYAVWANGVKGLLPMAEWVMFVRGEKDLAAVAPWEKAEQLVGHLMKPTDYYPDRVLVDAFPTDAELEALGKSDP